MHKFRLTCLVFIVFMPVHLVCDFVWKPLDRFSGGFENAGDRSAAVRGVPSHLFTQILTPARIRRAQVFTKWCLYACCSNQLVTTYSRALFSPPLCLRLFSSSWQCIRVCSCMQARCFGSLRTISMVISCSLFNY